MREIDEMNKILVDNFKDVGKRVEKFEETLHLLNDVESANTNNSLVYTILFALRFDISDKTDVCDEKEVQQKIDDN